MVQFCCLTHFSLFFVPACLPACLLGWLAGCLICLSVAEFLTFEALRPVARPGASTATASPPRVAFRTLADRINCNDIELDGEQNKSLLDVSQSHLIYISILSKIESNAAVFEMLARKCGFYDMSLRQGLTHNDWQGRPKGATSCCGIKNKSGRFNTLTVNIFQQQCFHVNNFYSF